MSMAKATPTFYLFHGDDDLRIEEEVAKMRARMGDPTTADMNTSEFDGTVTDAAQVLGAVTSYPFLADKRLVVVKDLLTHITRKGAGDTGKKAVERLVRDLPLLPDYARLVFVERVKLPDSNKILKAAHDHDTGFEKAFVLPKDSSAWILTRAKEAYNAQIDGRAAAALASVVGSDTRRADNELFKLAAYVGDGRAITEADVALLTPYVAEATVFSIIDAIAEGRGKTALDSVRRYATSEDDIFALYGMITRQFRLLLLTKEYLAGGGSPKQIASALSIAPYTAEKVAVQSRSFTVDQLESIYRRLHEYDVQIKTGEIKIGLAVDLLIAGLTR